MNQGSPLVRFLGDIIGESTPEVSTISALLFKRIADFQHLGKPANVICCIGITRDELDFTFEHGTAELLQRLPADYLLTDLRRKSHLKPKHING